MHLAEPAISISKRPGAQSTPLDLAAANTYVTKAAGLPAIEIPGAMRELIEQYGTASKRIYQIANYVKDKNIDGQPFVFSLDKVSIKAPIKYPWNLLNMAANYWSHAKEMGVNKDVDQDRDAQTRLHRDHHP